jgi:glycosyltransferase involved in cell wall biosynthesis
VTSPLPISVVIVARNEAQTLPRCLASVQGWVAEILVVLNHTTDDSATVAARLGATVLQTEWRGFRDTKNWALDRAAQPWALCLDADEEVSPALQVAITAFFARGDRDAFAGARFPRKVWFIDRWITHGDWYPDLSLRLIHRDKRPLGRR